MKKKKELELPKKFRKLTKDEMRMVEGGDRKSKKWIEDWLRKHL